MNGNLFACILTVGLAVGLVPTRGHAASPPACPDVSFVDPQGIHAADGQNGRASLTSDFSSVLPRISDGCRLATVSIGLKRSGSLGKACAVEQNYSAPIAVGSTATIGFDYGQLGSGHKRMLGSATVKATSVDLSEESGGWGKAGGHSTAACISDVKLVLHSVPK